MPFNKIFAERLKDLMIEKNISVKELANDTGIGINAVYVWLRGESEPLLSTIYLIADIFNCSIDYLVGREN